MKKSEQIKAVLAFEAFGEIEQAYRSHLINRAIAQAATDEDRITAIRKLHGFDGFIRSLRNKANEAD